MINDKLSITRKLEDFNADERIQVKLLQNHIHFLTGEINNETIGECIKWITYENLDTKQGRILTLYINSTGGDLYEAFALIDIMKTSTHPIRVIGMGAVMSAAFLIFASGTKGERYAAPNTSFMCHQFTENMESKYHDLKATMKESDLCNAKMVKILQDATDLTSTKIKNKLLTASDVYLTAKEVVDLGVADLIIGSVDN
jgi:ATP-dependent Clp protease protease subunit